MYPRFGQTWNPGGGGAKSEPAPPPVESPLGEECPPLPLSTEPPLRRGSSEVAEGGGAASTAAAGLAGRSPADTLARSLEGMLGLGKFIWP